MSSFTRRTLLQGTAAAYGASALLGPASRLFGQAHAQTADQNGVLLIFLVGGYNALFGSANSFVPAGTFGSSAGTVQSLGNNVFVDKATYGTNLPASALTHYATVGVNHRLSSHFPARTTNWTTNNARSYPLMLAKEMGGATARLPCTVVGQALPNGPRPAEVAGAAQISLQQVTDLAPTLDLAGATTPPGNLARGTTRQALLSAQRMSATRTASAPASTKSAKEAYDSSTAVLAQAPASGVGFPSIQTAYGLTSSAVNTFTAQMMAAETMFRLGTKVVLALHNGWDTHGDTTGTTVRTRMNSLILPGLNTFLTRMMSPTSGFNITTCIFGDFARSLPGSDHASCLSASVIGKKIKVGTTGNVDANVGMATTVPSVPGLWALLAKAAQVPTAPFGVNPHTSLLLP